jgi:predicted aspartyl protease
MIVLGQWSLCEDGVVRPIVRAPVENHAGEWIEVDFLVDTGADRTVFIAADAEAMGLAPVGSRDQLIGIGGTVGSYQVAATIRFKGTRGEILNVKSHYPALTPPKILDQSILGRDILCLFALILDRRAERVWLVGEGHQYRVEPTPT